MDSNRSWVRIPYGGTAEDDRMPAPPAEDAPDDLCGGIALAMAYVKRQRWGELYEPEAGLGRGTVFTELDLPFMGEGACPRGE